VVLFNPEVLSENTEPDTLVRYVDISAVDSDGLIETPEEMLFSEAPSRARRFVRPGDVIVSTVRTYLTAISLVKEEGLTVSTGFAVLRPRPTVNSQFLGYWMRSRYMVDEIVARSTGVAAKVQTKVQPLRREAL
jgi:type I restriction enzyme, S subunit